MPTPPEVESLASAARAEIQAAADEKQLESLRVRHLGEHSALRAILRSLGSLPIEERKALGRAANQAQALLQEAVAARRAELEEAARVAAPLDVTMPGRYPRLGCQHILTRTQQEICDIFIGMGFTVVEGPEIETEYYNFTALNIPEHHPARDDRDTFYLGPGLLLRTETSAVQIRVMEKQKPPVRIIAPGRVYRRDAVDATHCHTFHQVEGLFVDRGVRFSDLKGTLNLFCQEMFGANVKTRFRPDFFPFTEPSAELSTSCHRCQGAGCPTCKGTGWLELAGCGMVNPKVLENVGYDPEQVSGFAFGMGLERIAMRKYGIPDLRLFWENDLRFLRQF